MLESCHVTDRLLCCGVWPPALCRHPGRLCVVDALNAPAHPGQGGLGRLPPAVELCSAPTREASSSPGAWAKAGKQNVPAMLGIWRDKELFFWDEIYFPLFLGEALPHPLPPLFISWAWGLVDDPGTHAYLFRGGEWKTAWSELRLYELLCRDTWSYDFVWISQSQRGASFTALAPSPGEVLACGMCSIPTQ